MALDPFTAHLKVDMLTKILTYTFNWAEMAMAINFVILTALRHLSHIIRNNIPPLNFNDTFLDVDHLRQSFPSYEVKVPGHVGKEELALTLKITFEDKNTTNNIVLIGSFIETAVGGADQEQHHQTMQQSHHATIKPGNNQTMQQSNHATTFASTPR